MTTIAHIPHDGSPANIAITPTVGRIVWLRPQSSHRELLGAFDDRHPVAAIVTYVWGDRMVNVTAFPPHGGAPVCLTSVQLLQDDDAPNGGTYAEWMPYQKGQAARNA